MATSAVGRAKSTLGWARADHRGFPSASWDRQEIGAAVLAILLGRVALLLSWKVRRKWSGVSGAWWRLAETVAGAMCSSARRTTDP